VTLKKAIQIALAAIMVFTILAAPLSAVDAPAAQGAEAKQVAMWVAPDDAVGPIPHPTECSDGSSGNGCGGG
jgi:hypothetical protein